MKGHRWCCTIIYDESTRTYRANMLIEGKYVEGLEEGLTYLALRKRIRALTGIEILKRTSMKFERLSDFEKYATIDATQTRHDGRVTAAERLRGWKPDFS